MRETSMRRRPNYANIVASKTRLRNCTILSYTMVHDARCIKLNLCAHGSPKNMQQSRRFGGDAWLAKSQMASWYLESFLISSCRLAAPEQDSPSPASEDFQVFIRNLSLAALYLRAQALQPLADRLGDS